MNRQDLDHMLIHNGWHRLSPSTASDSRWYRWRDKVRVELVVNFDTAGRVAAWSMWHNTRVGLDDTPGKRQRLEQAITDLGRYG